MKVFDIALKDLLRSLRSTVFLAFGLVFPLLMAGIFYFAFGGLGDGDGMPRVRVQFVSLDETGQEYGYFSAGEMLFQVLDSEELAELLQVTPALDVESARTAVDNQEADVAVIVPANFTAAVFDSDGRASIELYQDPTLTLGPAIVGDIVNSFVDTFAGSKIAAGLTYDLIAEQGGVAAEETLRDVSSRYAHWAVELRDEGASANSLIDLRSPPGDEGKPAGGGMVTLVGLIMAGMMVFYVFFTGAASAQSILQEEEDGTLSRLFTTPTPQSTILGAKFISIFVLLVLQVVVLLVVSSLVFKIDWGDPLPVALVTLGLVVVAASFGIFITSLLKDTRQTGIVYGGVMTVAGMVGMSSVFTGGASGPMDTVSLIVPQGWGVRAWRLLLEGGGLSDVLPPVAVMLALGVGFFVIGVQKFRKRFA